MNQPRFSQQPFKYVGGDPSLDLVNTADWTLGGPEQDRLVDYLRLLGWAEGAGVLSGRAGQQLKRLAGGGPSGPSRLAGKGAGCAGCSRTCSTA